MMIVPNSSPSSMNPPAPESCGSNNTRLSGPECPTWQQILEDHEDNQNNKSNKKSLLLRLHLGPYDVVCSRSCAQVRGFPGNQRYNHILEQYAPLYQRIKSRCDRVEIMFHVIQQVHDAGGRFVKLDTSGKNDGQLRLVQVSNLNVRQKVAHALRGLGGKHGIVHKKKPRTNKTKTAQETKTVVKATTVVDQVAVAKKKQQQKKQKKQTTRAKIPANSSGRPPAIQKETSQIRRVSATDGAADRKQDAATSSMLVSALEPDAIAPSRCIISPLEDSSSGGDEDLFDDDDDVTCSWMLNFWDVSFHSTRTSSLLLQEADKHADMILDVIDSHCLGQLEEPPTLVGCSRDGLTKDCLPPLVPSHEPATLDAKPSQQRSTRAE